MTSAPSARGAFRSKVTNKFRSFDITVRKASQKLRVAISKYVRRLWFGARDEEQKVVVRRSFTGALFQCSIHLLAVSATATIAYFNIAGFFIGEILQGLTSNVVQAVDVLCLQVTAKILVIDSN